MSDLALTGGHWYNDRGIMRWQADEPVADVPLVITADEAIVCTTCGATASQCCRAASGGYTSMHEARTTPRMCACGAALGPRRKKCDPCALEGKRANQRARRARNARRAEQEKAA